MQQLFNRWRIIIWVFLYKLLLNSVITVSTDRGGVNAMPTNKAPFTFHLEEVTLLKIKHIAKQETRSASNLIEHICKTHVTEYEEKHGEIIVKYET